MSQNSLYYHWSTQHIGTCCKHLHPPTNITQQHSTMLAQCMFARVKYFYANCWPECHKWLKLYNNMWIYYPYYITNVVTFLIPSLTDTQAVLPASSSSLQWNQENREHFELCLECWLCSDQSQVSIGQLHFKGDAVIYICIFWNHLQFNFL